MKNIIFWLIVVFSGSVWGAEIRRPPPGQLSVFKCKHADGKTEELAFANLTSTTPTLLRQAQIRNGLPIIGLEREDWQQGTNLFRTRSDYRNGKVIESVMKKMSGDFQNAAELKVGKSSTGKFQETEINREQNETRVREWLVLFEIGKPQQMRWKNKSYEAWEVRYVGKNGNSQYAVTSLYAPALAESIQFQVRRSGEPSIQPVNFTCELNLLSQPIAN